ncbi:MAG: HD domain-containing protein [Candidatus Kuenenbacteria bacterium]
MKDFLENQNIKINKRIEVEKIIDSFFEKFPEIAKKLIQTNQNLSNEEKKSFSENPDDPSQHELRWHQWGIITHTKMTEKAYKEQVPMYLENWKLKEKVTQYMSEQIDGVSKDQLLSIAILFHDLGKFAVRETKEGGTFSFKKHEIASGKIIRTQKFSKMIKQEYRLTDTQIEYIARCAELHYELGIMRDEAKKTEAGYTLSFIESNAYKNCIKNIMEANKGFELEIGLLYLADFLGKTDDIQIDDSIDNKLIRKTLEQKGINPKFFTAIKQLPISKEAVKTYLQIWAETKYSKKDI